jgi:hypothetical protein
MCTYVYIKFVCGLYYSVWSTCSLWWKHVHNKSVCVGRCLPGIHVSHSLIIRWALLWWLAWYQVPSGTVKFDFLWPLIKMLDDLVRCFDAWQVVRYNAQVYEKNRLTSTHGTDGLVPFSHPTVMPRASPPWDDSNPCLPSAIVPTGSFNPLPCLQPFGQPPPTPPTSLPHLLHGEGASARLQRATAGVSAGWGSASTSLDCSFGVPRRRRGRLCNRVGCTPA